MAKSISQLQKQAKAAPKYVLHVDHLDQYIAEQQPLSGFILTPDLELARKFSVGFDNEEMKLKSWQAILNHSFECTVEMNIVYL